MKHVDQDVADLLGLQDDDGKNDNITVDPALINIWKKLINKGLDKEVKTSLMKEYPRYFFYAVIIVSK